MENTNINPNDSDTGTDDDTIIDESEVQSTKGKSSNAEIEVENALLLKIIENAKVKLAENARIIGNNNLVKAKPQKEDKNTIETESEEEYGPNDSSSSSSKNKDRANDSEDEPINFDKSNESESEFEEPEPEESPDPEEFESGPELEPEPEESEPEPEEPKDDDQEYAPRPRSSNSFVKNSRYQCLYSGCLMKFQNLMYYSIHLNDKHQPVDEKYKCNYDNCRCEYKWQGSLFDHIKRHHNVGVEKQHPCDMCGKKFDMPMQLRWHKLDVHECDEYTYKCTNEKCLRLFKSQASLEKHRSYMHNKNQIPCTFDGCDKKYKHEKNLKQHIRDIHTEGKDVYRCPYDECKKSYDYGRDLSRHINQMHHDKIGVHFCKFESCGHKFKYLHNLLDHVRFIHTDKASKLFKCKCCLLSFNKSDDFRGHVASGVCQSRKVMFKCKFQNCVNQYSHIKSVRRHVRTQHDQAEMTTAFVDQFIETISAAPVLPSLAVVNPMTLVPIPISVLPPPPLSENEPKPPLDFVIQENPVIRPIPVRVQTIDVAETRKRYIVPADQNDASKIHKITHF